jgi:hypothetical protein
MLTRWLSTTKVPLRGPTGGGLRHRGREPRHHRNEAVGPSARDGARR